MADGAFRGEVTAAEAFARLSSETGAALVDVRTEAEWAYVGVPDLTQTNATFIRVEWQVFPSMQKNPDFVESTDAALREAGCGRDAPVFFICRSGARSASAAAAMTAAGYTRCFNVVDGFEGSRDAAGHRGAINGWKAAALPWIQS